ncbi:MAG: hypothetical protein GC171_11210 [Terrimonas sp.]|nr:hypothetical protein [Terrimonas sp.]
MEYSKIVSVTGLPGLYELITSKGDGAIVRSLDEQKAKFVSGRVHNFSQLESIEIFTLQDNVNLVEVFAAMEKAGSSLPDTKDNTAVKKYFEKVFPDMDFERVYPSDMKKMVKWYEILNHHKIEIKLSETEPETVPVAEAPATEEKPKKAAKKTAVKKEKTAEEETPKKATKKK